MLWSVKINSCRKENEEGNFRLCSFPWNERIPEIFEWKSGTKLFAPKMFEVSLFGPIEIFYYSFFQNNCSYIYILKSLSSQEQIIV